MNSTRQDIEGDGVTAARGDEAIGSPYLWMTLPWPVVMGIGVVAVALIAWLDIITGSDISVPFLYLVPALVVTWFLDRRGGYIIAFISAGIWLFADFHGARKYEYLYNAWLNAATHLISLLVAVTVVWAFKSLNARLGFLVEHRTRSLRRLATQLSEAEDTQLRRLAHDIHDGFSQNLSVLKMTLVATLPNVSLDAASRRRIDDAVTLVNDLIERSRTLTFDLHPAMLDHLGLVPTLRQYAQQLSGRANIEITVSEDGRPRRLPGLIANYMFRSIKELFSNAARHGHARQIVAVVHWSDDQIRIVVDDDGSGFDIGKVINPAADAGLGLTGMRERMLSLGGTLRLESKPGEGTRAVLELPLNQWEIQL